VGGKDKAGELCELRDPHGEKEMEGGFSVSKKRSQWNKIIFLFQFSGTLRGKKKMKEEEEEVRKIGEEEEDEKERKKEKK